MTANKLIHETSPYLLQHAANPVNWHPWGKEALQKAKDENKPIFLSVGYSSCHWCHVMAHESFENQEIADIMNENFVNIKVDREERPDIDDIYQKVCQMTIGQGGWPLSVFLTPDQKPFYVGTYFSPLDNYGRHGFGSLLRKLSQAWRENNSDIQKRADNILDVLKGSEKITTPSKIEKGILDEAAINLLQIADTLNGGFGQAPKFPNAANLAYLFRYSKLSKISKFQEFSLKTLKKMARGGIFDQIGGGFHRYSTDARWLVPHFEKMLYDNALLPPVYVEAYQITKDPFYLDVAKKTLNYILREMTSPEGGFYSAQDADTQGQEGKTYVWKKSEVVKILGKQDSDVFCLFYDVTDGGNFEGDTILANNLEASAVAFHLGITEDKVRQIISSSSEKLLDMRSKRAQPGLDDKILTSWNALAITAFAKGYRVSHKIQYLRAAETCIKFIKKNLTDDGKLLRTYKNGKAKLDGYLEDYAYFCNALLDVFEITAKSEYLDLANHYANYLVDHFWDAASSSFYLTSDTHEKLLIRPKNNYDLSMPSGNSVVAGVLLRLFHLTQEKKFLDIFTKIIESHALMVAENPFAFGNLLNVFYMYLQKPAEITILNPENNEIYQYLTRRFLPESILVTVDGQDKLISLLKYPFFAGKAFPKDKTVVFVCRDFTCSLPLGSVSEIESQLSS